MISIITSLYRSDAYLDAYVKHLMLFSDALTKQKVDFEVIVIANDSTIKEKNLKEIFGSKKWFRFVEVELEPLYATWNRGVGLANGDTIGFWNVDDIRRVEAIIDGIDLISKGAELVYYPFTIKWYLTVLYWPILVKRRTILPPSYEKREFTCSMHCGPFFIFKKSLYEEIGPFDEQFKIVGDFDWCIRAAKKTNAFALSKESAGIFRVDGNGLSSGGKPVHVAENNIVYIRHGINDKIEEVDRNLMNAYKPDSILHAGKNITINS
jgi:glycosyltransferase involved in cell wall biosynthesis